MVCRDLAVSVGDFQPRDRGFKFPLGQKSGSRFRLHLFPWPTQPTLLLLFSFSSFSTPPYLILLLFFFFSSFSSSILLKFQHISSRPAYLNSSTLWETCSYYTVESQKPVPTFVASTQQPFTFCEEQLPAMFPLICQSLSAH